MALCFVNDVKGAYILGILFIFLNIMICFEGHGLYISTGIFGSAISGILIYGAKNRTSIAIQAWMILSVIKIITLISLAAFNLDYSSISRSELIILWISRSKARSLFQLITISQFLSLVLGKKSRMIFWNPYIAVNFSLRSVIYILTLDWLNFEICYGKIWSPLNQFLQDFWWRTP